MSVLEAGPDCTGDPDSTGCAVDEVCQLVVCRVGREECAMDIRYVQEINRVGVITPVPKTQPCVEGVINLRGRIIPVLDLGRRFGLPPDERSRSARIMVVTVRGRTIGLTVEAVTEVLRVPKASIGPPPSLGPLPAADFVRGVGWLDGRLVTVLDLERLLDPAAVTALEG
jgi:purine-binding chemotaxis protein CheW